MALVTLSVEDATRDQLASYATLQYGIEIEPRWNKNTILSRLRDAGFHADSLTMNVAGAEHEPREAAPKAKSVDDRPAKWAGRRLVKLSIAKTNEPGGTEPVFVSVNGQAMYIPRGEPSWAPFEYYAALKEASYVEYAPSLNEREPLGARSERERFPMTVHHIDPDPAQAQAA